MSGAGYVPTTAAERDLAREVKARVMRFMAELNTEIDCQIVVAGVLLAACETAAAAMDVGFAEAKAEVIDIVTQFQPTKAN